MEGKGAALLVALLVAASAPAAILCCPFDVKATTLPITPKASPPSPGDTSGSIAIVIPLQGDVYPNGEFDVQMSFGNSHNLYTMNVDTGSDVPWVECEMPTQAVYPRPEQDKMIPCDDPRCKAVLASTNSKPCKSKERCDYQIRYLEDSAKGVLIADTLTLRLTNGTIIRPTVAFGCGRWVNVKDKRAPTHGILGLGSADIGILSQLSGQGFFGKVMGHCLNSKGGGFLFLGDYGRLPSSVITWAPVAPSRRYSLGPANLFWDKQRLLSSPEVLLDSGTTFTYFGLDSYRSFISALNRYVSTQRALERAYDDRTEDYCWRGPRRFRFIADAERYFKISLQLRFANGAALMTLPPLNYLIISDKGNACLGILNGTKDGLDKDVTLIGGLSMLNRLVIYDNEKQRIGWANTDYCSV